jgi:hypothetical protein
MNALPAASPALSICALAAIYVDDQMVELQFRDELPTELIG